MAAICEPKTLNTEFEGSDEDDDRESDSKESCKISGSNKGRNEDNFFPSSPFSMKPIYAMTKLSYSKIRDSRIALFFVLPTGCIDRETR